MNETVINVVILQCCYLYLPASFIPNNNYDNFYLRLFIHKNDYLLTKAVCRLISDVGKFSKCENYDNVRIRRLCATILALFNACNNIINVPQLDYTALEPLIQYHLSICQNPPNPSLRTILGRSNLDLVYVVSSLVEQVR
ncbi:hypothetical protein LOAG_08372 [Loa loa]|uniref:Uncharacterized protein n=1 Tax=Loa loa TaxID=7209 RepID=A0A1S0TTV6_LOALO|nr:hypothetical protein LOAG_08372 [Loa loa]EFO20120.1 hypothetical protein LOAG_08372 [Loa loa]